MEYDKRTSLWRVSLGILAFGNVGIYVALIFRRSAACPASDSRSWSIGGNSYTDTMQVLALPYVFQTAWRSILISEYPNRRTITGHPLNSVLLARLLAAVGEFCF